jgi:hypothetical protein
MKINVGKIDRILRIVIALLIGVLYFTHQISGTAEIILMILAIIFILTGAIGFCPLYKMFGLKSTKKSE